MIILDTNIISEMMKVNPTQSVISWLNKQATATLFITTITIAEITYGLHALPAGARRKMLENAFQQTLNEGFSHRILSFDEKAAHLYGEMMGDRKALGRPLSILDGQIAAIARSQHAKLATRNSRDFIQCGVELINPFNE